MADCNPTPVLTITASHCTASREGRRQTVAAFALTTQAKYLNLHGKGVVAAP